jgi:hypothetical protein
VLFDVPCGGVDAANRDGAALITEAFGHVLVDCEGMPPPPVSPRAVCVSGQCDVVTP